MRDSGDAREAKQGLFQLPLWAFRRFGWWTTVPFVALTAIAAALLPRLEFQAGLDQVLPADDPYMVAERSTSELFANERISVLAVAAPEGITEEVIDRVALVSDRLSRIDEVGSVLSLTTIEDLYLDGETLGRRRLVEAGDVDNLYSVRERVRRTPLFRTLFLASGGDAVFIHVLKAEAATPELFAERLISEVDDPDLRVIGDDVVDHLIATSLVRQLPWLGVVALAAILLMEVFLTRSVRYGATLSIVSLCSAVWVLGLFSLIGEPVTVSSAAVPVIVMMIGTSYAIHLFRHCSMHEWDIEGALRQTGAVILAAGLTTMVGFLSLTITPSAVLRELGLFVMVGILASLLWSLLFLPLVLSLSPRHAIRRSVALSPDPGRRVTKVGGIAGFAIFLAVVV